MHTYIRTNTPTYIKQNKAKESILELYTSHEYDSNMHSLKHSLKLVKVTYEFGPS